MDPPFTVEQFLAVFARYNEAVWPMPFVCYGIAASLVVFAWLAGQFDRWVAGLLAGWGQVREFLDWRIFLTSLSELTGQIGQPTRRMLGTRKRSEMRCSFAVDRRRAAMKLTKRTSWSRGNSEPDASKEGPGLRRLVYLVLLMLFVFLWILPSRQAGEEIPYSEFEDRVAAGEVVSVVIGEARIEGIFREGDGPEIPFVTAPVDPELAGRLREHGVAYTGDSGGSGLPLTMLFWLLLTVGLIGFWLWFFRRMGRAAASGPLTFGKSHAKVYIQEQTGATFQDVAGVDEAKAELQEVVSFLKDPDAFTRLGAHLPKGVLLVGPPGTGKTLLARAVAGEAGVPFFSINGSEFVELFVGVGAARVRDLFEQARLRAPCIVFIDELDALGRARGLATTGGSDEKEQTLNQLLAEMDGFSPESRVILLAATNRPEVLDPALLRAGRFDRQILVDRPDKAGRMAILDVHLRRVKLGPDVDREQIAALTPGFTGADLANLVNEATLVATRRGGDSVALEDFTVALERVVAGLAKKSRVISARERAVVAHHEMGHALVAKSLRPLVDPVEKVSIIPHGIAGLGYTLQRPTEDRYLIMRGELEARLAVLLGGRAAEALVFGEVSSGAADDLEKATEIAREMVMRLGMDSTVGPVAYAGAQAAYLAAGSERFDGRRFSEQTAREIETAVRDLVQNAFEKAEAILRQNREPLERGAHLLLEKETLTAAEIPHVTPQPDAGSPVAVLLPVPASQGNKLTPRTHPTDGSPRGAASLDSAAETAAVSGEARR
jgi:cell division protease FtsH